MWLRGVNKDVKLLLLLGGAVTYWSIWLSRNDIVLKKNYFSYAGYLFGYPLATYLGYPAEAGFAGYSCSGITTVDSSGQGFFFSRTHGWRSSLRIDSH